MSEQDRKLEGFLLKQGEGTLGRAFKKRWFSQKGTCLYYYRNKSDTNTAGFINLAEAISCHPTEGVKGKFLFQINTPRRIWHLEAESESAMQYWVDGIKAIFNKLREEEERGRQFDRRSVRLETMENRVRDLEARDQLLKQALELACVRLGVPPDQVLTHLEKGGVDSVKQILESNHSGSTSTSSSASAAEQHTAAATAPATEDSTPTPAAAHTEDSSSHAAAAAATTTEDSSSHAAAAAAEPEATHAEPTAAAHADEDAKPAAEHPPTSHDDKPAEAEHAPPSAPATEATDDKLDDDKKGDDKKGDDKKGDQPDKRFKAKVLYDYTAQQDYEMTIHTNEIITVLSKHGNGWWLGASAEGKQGYFPGSYVEPLSE